MVEMGNAFTFHGYAPDLDSVDYYGLLLQEHSKMRLWPFDNLSQLFRNIHSGWITGAVFTTYYIPCICSAINNVGRTEKV